MIKKIKSSFLKSSNKRSHATKVSILLSLFFRSASVLFQFALIPLTINYLHADNYGVWITLSSLVGWIAMFDLGIANGLKNKLSESLAEENFEKAKMYISTTFILVSIFSIILLIVYVIFLRFIKWQIVFNSPFIDELLLRKVISVVVFFFLLKFITDIINVLVAAFQKVHITSFLLFLSNLLLLVCVYFLSQTNKSDFLLLSVCLSVIPFIVSLLANFYLFHTNFKAIKPSFRYINFKQSKGILSLGSKFLVLQVISLIIYQTDNILIAHLFTPKDVTIFNIAYKYYSIIIFLFSIILSPYWTAFNESFYKKDFLWINTNMNSLVRYWGVSIICLLVMLSLSGYVIKIWVGNHIVISYTLSICIIFYVSITNWNNMVAIFLNGVGKIRLQMYSAIFFGFFNIPLTVFLVKVLKCDIWAMPVSNFVCLLPIGILGYIQYKKIVLNKASGVWNK